jgi:hypothetical protein
VCGWGAMSVPGSIRKLAVVNYAEWRKCISHLLLSFEPEVKRSNHCVIINKYYIIFRSSRKLANCSTSSVVYINIESGESSFE